MSLFGANVQKKEKLLVILLSFIVPLISVSPNIFAYFRTSEGKVFSGTATIFSQTDVFTYFADMRQGFEGNWLWENRYTFEGSAEKAPVFLLYIFLGHLARTLGFSIPFTYHLSAYVFGVALLLFSYKFLFYFILERKWRIFSFSLLCFSSVPIALFEGLSFLTMIKHPHFSLSTLLFLFILFRGFRLLEKFGALSNGKLFLAAFLLCSVHPYMLAIACGILFIFGVANTTTNGEPPIVFFRRTLSFFTFCAVVFFSNFIILYRSDATRVLIRQNGLFKPAASYYALLLIMVFFLSFAFFRVSKKIDAEKKFLLVWFLFQSFMMILPFRGNVLVHKGYPMVFFLLFVILLAEIRWRVSNFILLMIVFSLSTLNLGVLLAEILEPPPFSYLNQSDYDVLIWLENYDPGPKRILSSCTFGNIIPAYTRASVFCGHWNQTVSFDEKDVLAKQFSSQDMVKEEARSLVKRDGIRYVMWAEREGSRKGNSKYSDFLERIYSFGDIEVFEVI